tara:strand:+ start:5406 stop:6269 length:864 start_codon:yes stop_codon:yes gene_type:complete
MKLSFNKVYKYIKDNIFIIIAACILVYIGYNYKSVCAIFDIKEGVDTESTDDQAALVEAATRRANKAWRTVDLGFSKPWPFNPKMNTPYLGNDNSKPSCGNPINHPFDPHNFPPTACDNAITTLNEYKTQKDEIDRVANLEPSSACNECTQNLDLFRKMVNAYQGKELTSEEIESLPCSLTSFMTVLNRYDQESLSSQDAFLKRIIDKGIFSQIPLFIQECKTLDLQATLPNKIISSCNFHEKATEVCNDNGKDCSFRTCPGGPNERKGDVMRARKEKRPISTYIFY